MDVNVDPTRLLFGVGALLGIAALVYFGFEVIAALSPTVKAAALFLGFVAFLAAAQGVEDAMETLTYVLGAGSYIVFLIYTVGTFEVSTDGVFLLLAASSGLFVALGYVIGVRERSFDDRHARLVVAGVLVVLALLVVVDAVGAQPTVDRRYEDTVTVPSIEDREPRRAMAQGGTAVGTLTVANGFVLSRTADLPRTRVCVAPMDREMTLRYRHDGSTARGDVLLGGTERREYGMLVAPDVFINRSSGGLHDAFADVDEIPVERGEDCGGRTEPAIVVIEEGDATVPARDD